jgi:hypothetical protein
MREGKDTMDKLMQPNPKTIREEAEERVIAIRGSWDVPGFDACVEAEIDNIKQGRRDAT